MSRPDDLELLEADVRASAPRMSPELERRLEAIVARPPRKSWRAPAWRPALAVGMACALIAVVAVAVWPHQDATHTVEVVRRPAESAGSSAAATAAPARGSDVLTPARRVERNTALTLATPARSFDDVADAVVQTTDRFGGIVQRSNVDQTGRHGEASFDLRIPATRLEAALAALSRLAHVRSRSAGSVDVTGAFNSAQGRLADARAERRALLRALAAARTQAEIASVRARLADARRREARARRTVERLRARTDLARVDVSVVTAAAGAVAPPPDDGRWTPGDALHDALRVLEVAMGVVLVALAALLPAGGLAALAVGGARLARRRRRDAALSA